MLFDNFDDYRDTQINAVYCHDLRKIALTQKKVFYFHDEENSWTFPHIIIAIFILQFPNFSTIQKY